MSEVMLIHGQPVKVISVAKLGDHVEIILEDDMKMEMSRGRYNAECSRARGALGKKVQSGNKIRNGEKVKRNNRNKIIK